MRRQIEALCDAALHEIIKILACDMIVGIGKYAEEKARRAVEALSLPIRVASIMHPSPANPAANSGKWEISVDQSFKDLGLYEFFK